MSKTLKQALNDNPDKKAYSAVWPEFSPYEEGMRSRRYRSLISDPETKKLLDQHNATIPAQP